MQKGEEDIGFLKEKITKLNEEIEWLNNELLRIEDYYKELLEQKEMECQQLRDELSNYSWREY